MENSTALDDPFQVPSSSFFIGDPTLDLSEPINDETYPLNLENNQEWDDLFDSEDPLSDPVLWELCHGSDDVIENSRAGPSEQGCSSHGMNDYCPQNPQIFGEQSGLLVPASQYNCICCHVLREITHANGVHVKRLEIHGAFGVITHAVLGIYDFYTSMLTQDFQMFDFHKESAEMVKKFLVQYFEACKQEGYTPMHDPLSTFYEALSVGLNEPETMNDFPQLLPENTGDYQYETLNQSESGSNQGGSLKIPLSMQRERTRKLKLMDFKDYFSLPIGEAAQKLSLCPTVVKKICRKHGVKRWPYRKIKSIERKLSKSIKILDASVGQERRQILEDIQKYKQELANIYEPFTN